MVFRHISLGRSWVEPAGGVAPIQVPGPPKSSPTNASPRTRDLDVYKCAATYPFEQMSAHSPRPGARVPTMRGGPCLTARALPVPVPMPGRCRGLLVPDRGRQRRRTDAVRGDLRSLRQRQGAQGMSTARPGQGSRGWQRSRGSLFWSIPKTLPNSPAEQRGFPGPYRSIYCSLKPIVIRLHPCYAVPSDKERDWSCE